MDRQFLATALPDQRDSPSGRWHPHDRFFDRLFSLWIAPKHETSPGEALLQEQRPDRELFFFCNKHIVAKRQGKRRLLLKVASEWDIEAERSKLDKAVNIFLVKRHSASKPLMLLTSSILLSISRVAFNKLKTNSLKSSLLNLILSVRLSLCAVRTTPFFSGLYLLATCFLFSASSTKAFQTCLNFLPFPSSCSLVFLFFCACPSFTTKLPWTT